MRGRYAAKRAKYIGGKAVSEHSKLVDPAPSQISERHRAPIGPEPIEDRLVSKTCSLCGRTGQRGFVSNLEGAGYRCSAVHACAKRSESR